MLFSRNSLLHRVAKYGNDWDNMPNSTTLCVFGMAVLKGLFWIAVIIAAGSTLLMAEISFFISLGGYLLGDSTVFVAFDDIFYPISIFFNTVVVGISVLGFALYVQELTVNRISEMKRDYYYKNRDNEHTTVRYAAYMYLKSFVDKVCVMVEFKD